MPAKWVSGKFFKAAALSLCFLAFAYPAKAESISGTVSDKDENGEKDVCVVYRNDKYLTQEMTATDENGLYSFSGIANGLARVRVEPAADTGYAQRENYAYLIQIC